MTAPRGALRVVAGAAAVVVAVTAITLAAVYVAGTESTARVASDAAVYGQAESMLAGATATQSRLSEALTVWAATGGRVDDARLLTVETTIAETESRAETLGKGLAPSLTATDEYLESARNVSDSLAAGVIPPDAVLDDLDRTYSALVDEVVAIRRDAAIAVNAARSQAGTMTTAARSFVVIIVPLLAVYFANRGLRNRQRRRELEMQLEVERDFRQEKDRLIASVSHELRTPLTGVLGLAESLREGRRSFNSGERNRMIETIADEAQELAHSVDNLVVVSRMDSDLLAVTAERIDVRAAISKVTYGWEARTRSRLTVIGRGIAMADPHHFEHVLRNILNNAARHGGPEIEVRIHRGGMVVAIEVRDNGVGLSIDTRARKRLKPHGTLPTGLGLGLTSARLLTEHMGGTLDYRRAYGVTVFTLKLPVAQDADGAKSIDDIVLDPYRLRPSRADIQSAIDIRPPSIMYEPIVSLDAGAGESVVGYEALARFPAGGPPVWFREAEALGLGVDLELACIRQAVAGFHPQHPVDFLSVNVSDETLVSYGLREALRGIAPERIILELSEEAAIKSYESTSQAVRALQEDGYRLALDDVGQGETDLWHMLRMRPSAIKLDISIVRDLATVADLRAMVTGIVAFGNALGATVIAEGVEKPETEDCLRELGVPLGQGHLYESENRFISSDPSASHNWDEATWDGVIDVAQGAHDGSEI